jgi:hypothetical protein
MKMQGLKLESIVTLDTREPYKAELTVTKKGRVQNCADFEQFLNTICGVKEVKVSDRKSEGLCTAVFTRNKDHAIALSYLAGKKVSSQTIIIDGYLTY